MPRPALKQRVRYEFDNFMSRGGRSIFTSLVIVFLLALLLLIGLRALLQAVLPGDAGRGFGWDSYTTFLQLTDPGSMDEDLASRGWFQALAITAGVTGIVLLSTLIAFITTAVDRRLHNLRKGHSQVVEEGHTLILGWDEQRVVEIIRELVIANESRKRRAVVILADQDKEYMDDFLAIGVPERATTAVVTRSGNPSSLAALKSAAVGTASAAIVLSGGADSSPAALRRAQAAAMRQKPLLRAYLNAEVRDQIVAGDLAACQVWATTAQQAIDAAPHLKFIYPREGFSLYADCAVVLRESRRSAEARTFIEFLLRAEVAASIVEASRTATANAAARVLLPPAVSSLTTLFPSEETLARGEWFKALPPAAQRLRDRLWTELKSG